MTPIELANQVKQETARQFGVSVESLEAYTRRKTVGHARIMAMVLIRELTDYSMPEITCWFFGGRDHSAIPHATQRHAILCETVPGFREKYESLRRQIQGIEDAVIELKETKGAYRCDTCNRFVAGGHECTGGQQQ